MNYWLFKSEPDEYSIDDLKSEPSGKGRWDGIRNYQARNLLRDHVRKGDKVFFYYSSCKVPGVAGIAKVVSNAYADPTQFDANSAYFDSKASEEEPRWFCVDLKFIRKFPAVIPIKTLKSTPELDAMVLLKQGRLSIQPVTENEWKVIEAMAN